MNKRVLQSAAAGLTAIAVLGVSLYLNVTSVSAARSTFAGVEKIRENNSAENVFEILEVVPDESMGSIGYYVKGSEPSHEILSNLISAKDRKEYMEKLQTLADSLQIMGPEGSSVTDYPLTKAAYEELYEGLVTEEEFEAALAGGDWNELIRGALTTKNLLEDVDLPVEISANTIPENTVSLNTVSSNSMFGYGMEIPTEGVSGDFIPYYEPVGIGLSGNSIANPAREFFYDRNEDFRIASALDGEEKDGLFDPHLVKEGIEGARHYQAVFSAIAGKVGYLPEDPIAVSEGMEWNPDWLIGTPLYQMDDEGCFVYKGTLNYKVDGEKNVVHIVTAPTGRSRQLVTGLDGMSARDERAAGNMLTAVTVSFNTTVSTNKAEGDRILTSPLDAEVLGNPAEDEESVTGADEDTYFALTFTYDARMEYPDRMHYQVDSLMFDENGRAPYFIDDFMPLVPNGAGTGLIAPDEDKIDPQTIVYHYDRGNGIYQAVEKEDAVTAVCGMRILYRGGFTNNEWFKQFVFELEDDELENAYIHVRTITARELEENGTEGADLVYLTNSHGEFLPDVADYEYEEYGVSDNDISRVSAIDILGSVIKEKLPIIVDAGLADGDSNLSFLATLLMQDDPEEFYDKNSGKSEAELAELEAPDDWREDNDKHFVQDSIYIYNNNSVNGENLVNKEFDTFYGDAIAEDGFESVLEQIETENTQIEAENDNNGSAEDKELIQEKVSEAVAIQYILSALERRGIVAKDTIRVLEIEPLNFHSSDLELVTPGNNRYTLLIKNQRIIENSASPIEITTMSTAEFVGRTEDVNAKYDLIYIGLNTGTFNPGNGFWAKMNTDRNGRTVYNNRNLNGLVYTNGDYIKSKDNMLSDSSWDDYYAYSGTDISKEKVKKLEEYIEAGYPLIFAENFYTGTTRPSVYTRKSSDREATGYIGSDTFMYELADFAKDYLNKNVMRFKDNVGVDNKTLEKYINAPKPMLINGEKHEKDSAQYYIPKAEVVTGDDGKRYLRYLFKVIIKGNQNKTTPFSMNLYVDSNADGRFSALTEKVEDDFVTDMSQNPISKDDLDPGVKYYLWKELPANYAGVITWKLETYQNQEGKHGRRNSATGILHVESPERIPIHAIQIANQQGRTTTWNMEECLKNSNSLLYRYTKGSEANDIVKNYDLTVKTYYSNVFIEEYDKGNINMDDYDMLILGFADMYTIATSNDPGNVKTMKTINAIKDFIASGKSVLFSHDTTSFTNDRNTVTVNRWGYLFNHEMRELVGLDRFGILGSTSKELKDTPQKVTINGTTYTLNQGYTNWLLDYDSSYTYRNLDYSNYNNLKVFEAFGDLNSGYSNTIEQLNEGQITTYPYEIPDGQNAELKVANTHYQYYQIDLTGDYDDDGENDVVVWYTLKDLRNSDNVVQNNRIYQFYPRDARNNYYIYNRGNVTYTGAGHENVDKVGNENEVKLFINTLIASYYTGVKSPLVSIVENSNKKSNPTENIQAPFDAGLLQYEAEAASDTKGYVDLGETTTVPYYFYATDMNLIKDSSILAAKAYYEVPEGTAGAQELAVEGRTTYGIQMSETSIVQVDGSATEGYTNENGQYMGQRLEDGVVYRVDVPVSLIGNDGRVKLVIVVNDEIKKSSRNRLDAIKNLKGSDGVTLSKLQLFDLN